MTEIKRVRDWRVRLSNVIEDRRRTPFSEKDHCGIFLADCMTAMTGVDALKLLRGPFQSVVEGIAMMRRTGYQDLASFLAENLEEIHPSQMRAGDMAAITEETGWAGGVVNGERVTVLGRAGLGTVPRTDSMRGFRIP
jgi:hypothetical protein